MTARKTPKGERRGPDWLLWLHVRGASLWELVDLSLGREPDFILFGAEGEQHARLATLRRHVAAGSTILRRPELYVWTGESDSIHQEISLHSFRQWVEAQGWSVPPELRLLPKSIPLPDAPAAKPVQRRAAQEQAILAELRKLGHDPLALPRPRPGRACQIKAGIRASLGYSEAVMRKAWQRLRSSRDIRNA